MYFTWYLTLLVEIIITKYFQNTFCIMQIYDNYTEPVYLPAAHFTTKNLDNFYLDPHGACRNFLLQCENAAETFSKVERVIKYDSDGWYNNRRYLVIITSKEAFDKFFNLTLLTFVRDILIIFTWNQTKTLAGTKNFSIGDTLVPIELYTHRYIGQKDNNMPILLDVWHPWNRSFKYDNSLFPDKVTDQMGREFRAPCIARMPYASCDTVLKLGNEHNIVLKYVNRHNLTVNFYQGSGYAGNIFYNWTGTGFRGGLLKDEKYYDIVYGGFPISAHTDWIQSVTYTYEVSVPMPRIEYGWLYVFRVFRTMTWVLLFAAFISMYSVVRLRRFLFTDILMEGSKIKTLELFGIFIGQSCAPTQEFRNSFVLKFMVLLMLFCSILVCAAYNSRLSSIMVIPIYENDIKTLAECAASDYKLLFFDYYYLILREDTRDVYKKLYDKIHLIPKLEDGNRDYNLSEKLLSSGKFAVARYRRSNGEYYEEYEYLLQMYGRYKPVTPELFKNYYFFLLRKNSMHTDPLKDLVRTAQESGLMAFWEEQALRTGGNQSFQKKLQDFETGTSAHNLYIMNLKGCFAFWVICMLISCLVFLKELYNGRKQSIN